MRRRAPFFNEDIEIFAVVDGGQWVTGGKGLRRPRRGVAESVRSVDPDDRSLVHHDHYKIENNGRVCSAFRVPPAAAVVVLPAFAYFSTVWALRTDALVV